jgi:hypothetical protein
MESENRGSGEGERWRIGEPVTVRIGEWMKRGNGAVAELVSGWRSE